MEFKLSEWRDMYILIHCGVLILVVRLIYNKVSKRWVVPSLIISVVIFFYIFFSVIISMTGNPFITPGDTNTLYTRGYKIRSVYGELNEVNQCISNGYGENFENIDFHKYYYDYLDVVIEEKDITISQLISFMKNMNYNIVYTSKSKLHKITKELVLEGIIKKEVKDSFIKYSINDYYLDSDENKKISLLSNTQKMKLYIVYNQQNHDSYKHISEYVIINAESI